MLSAAAESLQSCLTLCDPIDGMWLGFPNSSVGKEFVCNAGDSSSIPGLGRFAGEAIGYPLQYSWASLVAQLVQNVPAMWETWVGKISGEGKGILASRIPWTL